MSGPNERTNNRETLFQWLEQCLVALDGISPAKSPFDLRALMVDVPPEARQLVLVELIKCDLAAAADVGLNRRLDFYLQAFADWLGPAQIPLDLVLEEVQLRREAGESPMWEEYLELFPHLASTMGRFLAEGEATARCEKRTPLPEFSVHQQVDDFFILAPLGQGAFARVYLARQESMQRLVALKATMQVSDEPQALSQLDHPNVVRVYDQRICQEPPIRLLYMQYIPGGTLADCIESLKSLPASQWSGQRLIDSVDRNLLAAGQISPERSATRESLRQKDWPSVVAWLGVQLAEGLHYAHHHGILHRDIKPANILLDHDANPKLADFNVSFHGVAGRAGAAVHFGGSLAYMSPEQLRVADPTDDATAEQLDCRSDLFSLGVVLWELWHGERPWKIQGPIDSWHAAVQSQRRLQETPLPSIRSQSAAERVLDRTLRQTLSHEPDSRPRSGAELAGALRLGLFPQVAERFFPSPGSWVDRAAQGPPLCIMILMALIPNMAAGLFNYIYNGSQLMTKYPAIWPQFERLSLWTNLTLFPLGLWLGWRKVQPVASAVRQAVRGEPFDSQAADQAWRTGHAIAMISGALWILAGIIFPVALFSIEHQFQWPDAVRFFVSMVVSGGVAIAYPFFGLTLWGVVVHYPLLIRGVMSDPGFAARRRSIVRVGRRYLVLSAITPLLALALLVLEQESSRVMLLATIATTALGLAWSYWAQQQIEAAAEQMATVLAPQEPSVGRWPV